LGQFLFQTKKWTGNGLYKTSWVSNAKGKSQKSGDANLKKTLKAGIGTFI